MIVYCYLYEPEVYSFGYRSGEDRLLKDTDDQINGIINSVMKICFLLSCGLFGHMSSAQNLRQEKTFLAISNMRLSEQHFGGVLMHHVAFSIFFRRKTEGNIY